MVMASGGKKAVEYLLGKDTHFAEGIALWVCLMRELAADMAQEALGGGDEQPARDFNDLLGLLLKDFERRFLTGAFDDSTGDKFSNGISAAYVRGLHATAAVTYVSSGWETTMGKQPPAVAEGKTFQQCIMTLHALITILVPDCVEPPDRPGNNPGGGPGAPSLEIAHDQIGFLCPLVLSSIRRHRGEALRWLTIKSTSPLPIQQSFSRVLRVRRAFIKSGAVDRVLSVLENCVVKLEAEEWPLTGLCVEDRISFTAFLNEEAGAYSMGGKEENTTLAEFLGSAILTFSASMSRLHPLNCNEGYIHMDTSLSSLRTLTVFRSLGGLLLRLLRGSFHTISTGDSRVPQSILQFVLRFLLSMALGSYVPLVEHVLTPRGSGMVQVPELNVGNHELHSPRALLLSLELLSEYPVSLPHFTFLVPTVQVMADFARRLLRAERNLELALDAGMVKCLIWCSMRPASASEPVELALGGLLAAVARQRVSSDDLRLWLNAVLSDYSASPEEPLEPDGRAHV